MLEGIATITLVENNHVTCLNNNNIQHFGDNILDEHGGRKQN